MQALCSNRASILLGEGRQILDDNEETKAK
jgi:hypothetical protein